MLIGGVDPDDPGRSLGTTNSLLLDLSDGSTQQFAALPSPLMFAAAGTIDDYVVVIGSYCNEITVQDEDVAIDDCSPDIVRGFVADLSPSATPGWSELVLPKRVGNSVSFKGTADGRLLFTLDHTSEAVLVDPRASAVVVESGPDTTTQATLCLDGTDLIAVAVTDSAVDRPDPGDGTKQTRDVWVKRAGDRTDIWRQVVDEVSESSVPYASLRVSCSQGGPLITSSASDGGSSRFDRNTAQLVPIQDPPTNPASTVPYSDVVSCCDVAIGGGAASVADRDGVLTLYRYTASTDSWDSSTVPPLPEDFFSQSIASDGATIVLLGSNRIEYQLLIGQAA